VGGRERKNPPYLYLIYLKIIESADKPGFVLDSHLSGIAVTNNLKQPTRIQRGSRLDV